MHFFNIYQANFVRLFKTPLVKIMLFFNYQSDLIVLVKRDKDFD